MRKYDVFKDGTFLVSFLFFILIYFRAFPQGKIIHLVKQINFPVKRLNKHLMHYLFIPFRNAMKKVRSLMRMGRHRMRKDPENKKLIGNLDMDDQTDDEPQTPAKTSSQRPLSSASNYSDESIMSMIGAPQKMKK